MALAPMDLPEPAGLQLPEHACQERTERHQRVSEQKWHAWHAFWS